MCNQCVMNCEPVANPMCEVCALTCVGCSQKCEMVCWVYVLIDALREAHVNTKRESVLGANATLRTSESMWTVRFKRCAMRRASNAQTRAKHHEQFPARCVQSACLHVTQPKLRSGVKVMVSGVNGKRYPGAPRCVGEACRVRTTYAKKCVVFLHSIRCRCVPERAISA